MPELLGYVSKIRIGTGEEVPINDDDAVQKSEFLDLFYPVGSYYETSDENFDPNIRWGGTWVLEAAGKVHIGAGTGYALGSTGGASTVTLTDAQIAHGHGFTNPAYKATGGAVQTRAAFNTGGMSANESHGHTYSNYTSASPTGNPNPAGVVWIGSGVVAGVAVGGISYTKIPHVHQVPAHSHGFTQPTITVTNNGSVANLGTPANRAAHNNMPPYIAVNRWHRTA